MIDCTITIHDAGLVETAFLGDVLKRLSQHVHSTGATSIDIYVNTRKPTGWLEYIAVIEYVDNGKLTVGCIQRAPGDSLEFHT